MSLGRRQGLEAVRSGTRSLELFVQNTACLIRTSFLRKKYPFFFKKEITENTIA